MADQGKKNIIRKIEVIEGHGHHGGAWKVAYADFMTAMMAFFLLMWILSSSDEQKLRGIAEYFTDATMPGGSGVLDGATFGPPGILSASNGTVVARGTDLGKVDDATPATWEVKDVTKADQLMKPAPGTSASDNNVAEDKSGGQVKQDQQMQVADALHMAAGQSQAASTAKDPQNAAGKAQDASDSQAPDHAADEARFAQLQSDLMQAMQDNPDLRPLVPNVVFEQTPEGLRIQIIDQEGRPMFASGRAEMLGATQTLLDKLGRSLAEMPNKMVISGHTDAVPFTNRKAYDNWDLSSDRANSTRRVLEQAGVDRARILRVSGLADTDPLVADAPKDARNRRISVLLQFEEAQPAKPAEAKPAADTAAATQQAQAAAEPAAEIVSQAAHNPLSPVVQAEPDPVLSQQVLTNLRSILR